MSGMNEFSSWLCWGGVGCWLGGTQTPMYGTSAQGPMGSACAVAGPEGTAALLIAATAETINLRLVIVDPSDDPCLSSVRRRNCVVGQRWTIRNGTPAS